MTLLLLGHGRLMELGGKLFADLLAQCLLDELAGIAARWAAVAFRLNRGLAVAGHDDLNSLQRTPRCNVFTELSYG